MTRGKVRPTDLLLHLGYLVNITVEERSVFRSSTLDLVRIVARSDPLFVSCYRFDA